VLDVSHLQVHYGGSIVLHDVSLHVPKGRSLAVTGPSGSGKTTLLRAIAGLLRISSGTISVDGINVTDLATHKRNIGLMFQDGQLFPHMTVAQNIGFGLHMQKLPKKERMNRVSEMLSVVKMSDYENRDVKTLSGGQARRIALARSLAPNPPVLLLDEPLTGLEHDLRYSLAEELAAIIRVSDTTTVVVTHDLREASILADNICALNDIDNS
jgi:thiamine transport system ATP-binding protein